MGHERVGALPRTRRWVQVVEELRGFQSATDVTQLAKHTLDNVRLRYQALPQDKGVQAAFGFLVSLATYRLPSKGGLAGIAIDLESNPAPLRLAQQLNSWVS
jgi:hypothetical protein